MFSASRDIGKLGHSLLTEVQLLDHLRLIPQRFILSGLIIDAWFSDVKYAKLCSRNLVQKKELGFDKQPDITLYLLDCESLGWPQPPCWSEDVFDRQAANDELSCVGLRGAYLHNPRVWQFYSKSQRVGVQLIRCPGALPSWESGGPLRNFLHWAYAAQGLRLCHAATLGINGRGVLLTGAGGSGKSCTTLAGIASGLSTVGDDYCLVEQAESVKAYPLYNILKQDAAGLKRVLGNLECMYGAQLNWQGKYEIHSSILIQSPFVSELDIRAIVLSRIVNSSRSVIRSVSPGLAMRAFAPSSIFQLPDGEREGISFIGRLCRCLPCFEILLSEDSIEIGNTVYNFLEKEFL